MALVAPEDSAPRPVGQAVLRWRLPVFAVFAVIGLVLLAVGWSSVRDGWYLTGIVLSALGVAGVLWVLCWRRPPVAVAAVIAVGVVVIGLGLGSPWRQVASAYSHEGVHLHESTAEAPVGPDQGFLLVRDNQVFAVDGDGAMRPWWEGTVREDAQVSRISGGQAVIYHGPHHEGIVYLLGPDGTEQTRWRFDLPQERESTWWDGGVVSVTAQTVVTLWCDDHQDCYWTGRDADSGEQIWTASGALVPNAGLGDLGLTGAGATATVNDFWVGVRTEEGSVQLRDPDTGSVVHTLPADEPVALAGTRAVVGSDNDENCTVQVLGTDGEQDEVAEGEGDEESAGHATAEVDCELVQALTHFPGETEYLDDGLLWLPGTSRSHVIDLDTAQTQAVDDRVFGGASHSAFYGVGGTGSWTAGAGVLTIQDGQRVRAYEPLTGASLWQAPLAGAVPEAPMVQAPVVIAAGGVVTVQVPDEAMVLEDSLNESGDTAMVLHAFDARTGEELMPAVRHREDPGSIEIHDGRVLFTVTEDDQTATYMFGSERES